jgi:hypothetical protein
VEVIAKITVLLIRTKLVDYEDLLIVLLLCDCCGEIIIWAVSQYILLEYG